MSKLEPRRRTGLGLTHWLIVLISTRVLRREAKVLINQKHKDYIDSIAFSVSKNLKRFWSYLKARTKSGSVPNIVTHNGNQYSTAETKAEAFNDFFLVFYAVYEY